MKGWLVIPLHDERHFPQPYLVIQNGYNTYSDQKSTAMLIALQGCIEAQLVSLKSFRCTLLNILTAVSNGMALY